MPARSASSRVVQRIVEQSQRLTATERKVAEILAEEPQTIAFGTVAQVAKRAGTSGPSVVRLAVKLGYGGFVDLQADVQRELALQLGPARDRIRQHPPTDLLGRVQAVEQGNIARSLNALSKAVLERAVSQLADCGHHVWVLPGEMTYPIGMVLASQLGQLRDGVELVHGSETTLSRHLAGLEAGDVIVGIDIQRYERSLVRILEWAGGRDATVLAVTDSPLSPLASIASEAFFFAAQGVGPFDSMTGGLALTHVLVAASAARLRPGATRRLDTVEAAWTTVQALVLDPPP
ncbi:MAG: MurR/RpiR family transcriptional regulator [Acidimicrobiales bacterium]